MKTYITLLRHAQSLAPLQNIVQGRGLDIPLSKEGEKQAEKVSELLKQESFDYVFSSTAKRAIDTATRVRKYHKDVPYNEVEALNERSKGEAEGMNKDDFAKKYPDVIEGWNKGKDIRPVGGENFEDVHKRVFPVLERHVERYKGKSLLYVTHGNVIRVVLGMIRNIPHGIKGHIEQPYCAISKIFYDHDEKKWGITSY